MGGLERSKEGWRSSLVKERNFHLPHFGITFEEES